jgi:hypothetical protein
VKLSVKPFIWRDVLVNCQEYRGKSNPTKRWKKRKEKRRSEFNKHLGILDKMIIKQSQLFFSFPPSILATKQSKYWKSWARLRSKASIDKRGQTCFSQFVQLVIIESSIV